MEESDTIFYFGQIGVSLHDIADERVLFVPNTMEIISHQVHPVSMAEQSKEIEVLKIPERRGSGECETESVSRRVELPQKVS